MSLHPATVPPLTRALIRFGAMLELGCAQRRVVGQGVTPNESSARE